MKTFSTAKWIFNLLALDNETWSWYAKTQDLEIVDNIEIVSKLIFTSKEKAIMNIIWFTKTDNIQNFCITGLNDEEFYSA